MSCPLIVAFDIIHDIAFINSMCCIFDLLETTPVCS